MTEKMENSIGFTQKLWYRYVQADVKVQWLFMIGFVLGCLNDFFQVVNPHFQVGNLVFGFVVFLTMTHFINAAIEKGVDFSVGFVFQF